MPIGIYKRSKKHLEALQKGGLKSRFKKGHPVPKKWRENLRECRLNTRSSNFKGGQTINHGYVYVWNPNHLRATYGQYHYVKRCILVMEKKIGRLLDKYETIHHINGIKSDDRPENLWLFPNIQAHQSYESFLRWTIKKWKKELSN